MLSGLFLENSLPFTLRAYSRQCYKRFNHLSLSIKVELRCQGLGVILHYEVRCVYSVTRTYIYA